MIEDGYRAGSELSLWAGKGLSKNRSLSNLMRYSTLPIDRRGGRQCEVNSPKTARVETFAIPANGVVDVIVTACRCRSNLGKNGNHLKIAHLSFESEYFTLGLRRFPLLERVLPSLVSASSGE